MIKNQLNDGCHGDGHEGAGDPKQAAEGKNGKQSNERIDAYRPAHDAGHQQTILQLLDDRGGDDHPDEFFR